MKATAWLIVEGRDFYNGRYQRCAVVDVRQNRPSIMNTQVTFPITVDIDPAMFNPPAVQVTPSVVEVTEIDVE